jgi:carbon monoxide dehydrogenase subunit G
MPGFIRRIQISADVARVFEVLTDLDRMPDWMPSVHWVENLTGGPLRKGSRLAETRDHGGRERTTELEVTGFDPPRMFRASGGAMGLTVTLTFRLNPRDPKTEVEYEAQVEGNWLLKPVAKRIAAGMERHDNDILERLQRVVELGTETRRLDPSEKV